MGVTDGTEIARDPTEHSLLEDAYAMFIGCTLIALGMVLMKTSGIVTAGMMGVALFLSYKVHLGVGALFFVVNIPFLLLGLATLGREFMVKTAIAIGLVFAEATVVHSAMEIGWVHPAFAALVGGTCAGMGILVLIRHKGGVGGVNVLALWAHKSRGWNVGKLQLVLDGLIILAAGLSLPLDKFAWSLLSVIAVNGVMITAHRPDRYLGH